MRIGFVGITKGLSNHPVIHHHEKIISNVYNASPLLNEWVSATRFIVLA